MENNHFGTLTERMRNFREELLNARPYVCAERAVLTTESYRLHADQPVVLKRAYMLQNILERMTIFIEPQTLIAGNQSSANRAAPIFPEYAMDWVIDELDQFEKRDGDVFYISEETKKELRELAPYWEHNTTKDKGLAAMPLSSRIFYDLGIIRAEGNITSGDAHLAVEYEKVMKSGLKDYKRRAREAMESLDLTEMENLKKYYFYEAVLIVIEAVVKFASRYSRLALSQAAALEKGELPGQTGEKPEIFSRNESGNRKPGIGYYGTLDEESTRSRVAELKEMARILSKVPYEPAETFAEAVQSMWLVHLVLQIESNGHSLSYGRMDQYLYPFYQKDLDRGIETEQSACEKMTNLWLKTFTINKIRSWSHTRFSAGSPLYQNVTIAGQTTEHKDAVNPMSFMILKSVAQTRLPQPNLTVRYHAGLSDEFMNECIEVVRLGFGMPAFNNDEIIIPSFIEKGVAAEDAYNYSAIGCVETAVPGKWGYRCTGMSFLNFPKSLLIALNDGVDPESGVKLCEGIGHFRDMTCFEDVERAWDKIIRNFTRHSVIIETCCDMVLEETVPDVLCSSLVEDCIGRGKTLKEGGAVYDFISGLQVGIANMADSLAAIKKCVFEDKSLSNEELWAALENNFEGEKGSRIRSLLLAAPKYGNDDNYVDSLIRNAYDVYIDEIKKYHNTRYGRGPVGGVYYAGTSSISANVGQGIGTPATPDGRKAKEPLAEGCSPSHGMDRNGPTAVFKTVAKLPTKEITGGVLLNQKVTPQLLMKEEDRMKLMMLIRTFFNRLHGYHVQYNVVSRETLRAAQKNPEEYRDLIVRVAGYSAFFSALSRQTQDDIIERTEQSL